MRRAYSLVRSLLFRFDPERMHQVALHAGRALQRCPALCDLLAAGLVVDDPRLAVQAMGMRFARPCGLAAGFDKNADLLDLLPSLGFGHVEVGTLTARAWAGNPRPRLFRLPLDGAIVNRMGLPNEGVGAVVARLRGRREREPVGVNVGRVEDGSHGDPIRDFADAIREAAPVASWITLNISCPNTEEGRSFEEPSSLAGLLHGVSAGLGTVPWLVKLSPDVPLEEARRLVDISLEWGAAGFVLTNTTTRRDGLATPARRISAVGRGGLSGRPLAEQAQERLRAIRRHVGPRVLLVGVGGIFTAEDAYRRIRAGASLLQVYTGLVYEGPGVAASLHRGLLRCLERDGLRSLAEAVGLDA